MCVCVCLYCLYLNDKTNGKGSDAHSLCDLETPDDSRKTKTCSVIEFQ
jgi:hypothetical protein